MDPLKQQVLDQLEHQNIEAAKTYVRACIDYKLAVVQDAAYGLEGARPFPNVPALQVVGEDGNQCDAIGDFGPIHAAKPQFTLVVDDKKNPTGGIGFTPLATAALSPWQIQQLYSKAEKDAAAYVHTAMAPFRG